MTGAVFHPGHDEWHGQTVVVYTTGAQTVIGRWDNAMGDRVNMMDVAVHEQGRAEDGRDEWVAHLKKYGIPVEHRSFAVPQSEVAKVVRLRDA